MAIYNQNPIYPTLIGGAGFSPYNYQTAVPLPQQPQQIQQANVGSIMMIQIGSDDEVNTYPVAAGTTVLLMNFTTKKFWLKSTNTSGVPEPVREFTFTEKAAPVSSNGSVSREEFNNLNEKLDKLIKELGGSSNG